MVPQLVGVFACSGFTGGKIRCQLGEAKEGKRLIVEVETRICDGVIDVNARGVVSVRHQESARVPAIKFGR